MSFKTIALIVLTLALSGVGVFAINKAINAFKDTGALTEKVENANAKTEAITHVAKQIANRPRTDDDTLVRLRAWRDRVRERENDAD